MPKAWGYNGPIRAILVLSNDSGEIDYYLCTADSDCDAIDRRLFCERDEELADEQFYRRFTGACRDAVGSRGETMAGGEAEAGEDKTENLRVLVNNLFNINGAEIQVLDASGKVLTTSLSSHSDYVGRKNTQTVVSRALQGIRDNEEYIVDEDNVRKKSSPSLCCPAAKSLARSISQHP